MTAEEELVKLKESAWLRFSKKYRLNKKGCWVWFGAKNNEGYGCFRWNNHWGLAHRFSYEQVKGKIPTGLEIDHLCRNRRCVRPHHLEAVTHQVNALRGESLSAIHAKKKVCPRGHRYTFLQEKHRLKRICKTCRRYNERAKYWLVRLYPKCAISGKAGRIA